MFISGLTEVTDTTDDTIR